MSSSGAISVPFDPHEVVDAEAARLFKAIGSKEEVARSLVLSLLPGPSDEVFGEVIEEEALDAAVELYVDYLGKYGPYQFRDALVSLRCWLMVLDLDPGRYEAFHLIASLPDQLVLGLELLLRDPESGAPEDHRTSALLRIIRRLEDSPKRVIEAIDEHLSSLMDLDQWLALKRPFPRPHDPLHAVLWAESERLEEALVAFDGRSAGWFHMGMLLGCGVFWTTPISSESREALNRLGVSVTDHFGLFRHSGFLPYTLE